MRMFTPLSMSSMLSMIPIAFRRESTPYTPSEKIRLPKMRKYRISGTRLSALNNAVLSPPGR